MKSPRGVSDDASSSERPSLPTQPCLPLPLPSLICVPVYPPYNPQDDLKIAFFFFFTNLLVLVSLDLIIIGLSCGRGSKIQEGSVGSHLVNE